MTDIQTSADLELDQGFIDHEGREASAADLNGKLNWLRAGVLGANDGIVSIAGLVMGVAGASASSATLLLAGLAGTVAGALSMAGGEYVSVSSQADAESAALDRKRRALRADPVDQCGHLAAVLRDHGLSRPLSIQVARELSRSDALGAHARFDLGISSTERTSAWIASLASSVAFTLGAIIPLLLMVLSPPESRVIWTVIGVIFALCLTGFSSAYLGGGPKWRPMLRNVIVGLAGMGITYFVGGMVGI